MEKILKGNKGATKIVIIVIILILILVIGGAVFFITNSEKFGFSLNDLKAINSNVIVTPKEKFYGVYAKIGDKVGVTTQNVFDVVNNSILKRKMDYSGPIEGEIELTANIKELPNLNDSLELQKNQLNESVFQMNFKSDMKNDKYYSEFLLNESSIGEFVYNPNAMALKIKDVDSKYMAIFKDKLKGTKYSDIEEIFEIVNNYELNEINLDDVKFTVKELAHFKDIYGEILSDTISDDMYESEGTKIEVDKKIVECDKISLKLTSSQIADILYSFANELENDDEGREILINKIVDILNKSGNFDDILDELDYTEDEFIEELENTFDDFANFIEGLADEFNELEGVEYEFIAYADKLNYYRAEIIIVSTEPNSKIVYTIDIKDDGIYTIMSLEQKDEEIMSGKINILEDKIEIFEVDSSMELNTVFEFSESKIAFNVNIDGEEEEVFNFIINLNIDENTEKAHSSEIELAMRYNLLGMKFDTEIKLKEKTKKVNSVDIPQLTNSNSVDLITTEKLDEYIEQLEDLMESITYGDGDILDKAKEQQEKNNDSMINDDISDIEYNNMSIIMEALNKMMEDVENIEQFNNENWYKYEGNKIFSRVLKENGFDDGNIKFIYIDNENFKFAGTVTIDGEVKEWLWADFEDFVLKDQMSTNQRNKYKELTGEEVF